MESILERSGFSESGGGDDFTAYNKAPDPRGLHIYIHDDGRWEAHDFTKQKDDNPESAQGSGKGPESLDLYLKTV